MREGVWGFWLNNKLVTNDQQQPSHLSSYFPRSTARRLHQNACFRVHSNWYCWEIGPCIWSTWKKPTAISTLQITPSLCWYYAWLISPENERVLFGSWLEIIAGARYTCCASRRNTRIRWMSRRFVLVHDELYLSFTELGSSSWRFHLELTRSSHSNGRIACGIAQKCLDKAQKCGIEIIWGSFFHFPPTNHNYIFRFSVTLEPFLTNKTIIRALW